MVSDQATLNILNWDGSLASSDFYVAACAFAEKWKKFNSALPQWSWVHCTNGCRVAASKVDGYLALQNMLLPRSLEEEQDEGNHHGKEEPSFSDSDEPSDTALLMSFCKVQSNDPNMHLYDFHVANSPSYRVPVLYFRAFTTDGQPLTLDDIEKDLPPNSAKILMESKWTFITQVEHPYLNRPWYTLHPCGTSEWLKLLFTNDDSVAACGVPLEQYLVSWFSVVGQVFGFRIPLEMLTSFKDSS